MSFTQQTFLGASIRNFSGGVGWKSQSSTLTVGLVEDPSNNDNFNPPTMGSPVSFSYDGWNFHGILQEYKRKYGQDGNPIIDVQLQSPTELLDGVQLILQDYTGGTYGLPNLYNIYGYLETVFGFGGSLSNDTGLPWKYVRDSFIQLQYQSPINFRGSRYICTPFWGTNILPDYYRVAGDSISLLGFIDDICSTAGYDYHITLEPVTSYFSPSLAARLRALSINYVIVTALVRRFGTVAVGAIDTFVNSTDGAVSKDQGYELRNEVTEKFVVGGPANPLYFQEQNYTDNDYYSDDVILPYWGNNYLDELSIGEGDFNGETGHEYTFAIDGRPIYIQTGHRGLVNYRTDLAEMHAALAGQDAWEMFLTLWDGEEDSVHYEKATIMDIPGRLNEDFIVMLRDARDNGPDSLKKTRPINVAPTDSLKQNHIEEEKKKKTLTKIYSYIHKFASEYYGKKFMVRIPFVAAALESGTNYIKTSLEPTDTGYVEEAFWAVRAVDGYMPYNVEKFTTQENKIYCYARFNNMDDVEREDEDGNPVLTSIRSKFALDKLSPQSYIIDQEPNLSAGNMRERLFVKSSISSTIVFENPITLTYPRVIITLDAPVPDNVDNYELGHTGMLAELAYFLDEGNLKDEEIDDWVTNFGSLFGNDFIWKARTANYNMPDMAAVPLKSNIERYGPWYAPTVWTVIPGKMDFEIDESLVPWNYGGFAGMINAGSAKAADALSGQQVYETGSVEFPGVPGISLGGALITNGPIITDINCNVGENGVTTTYRMQTWSYQFGRLGKYNVDRMNRYNKMFQEHRKAFRKLYGYREPLEITFFNYSNSEERLNSNTGDGDDSTTMIGADIITRGEGSEKTVKCNVAGMTTGKLIKTIKDAVYSTKAGISLDGIFAPFTNNTSADDDFPKFEDPVDGANSPTSADYVITGQVAANFVEGSSVPSTLSNEDSTPDKIRSIGLKAPIVVGGWGFDINGDAVPTDDNYVNRADTWKVGPLDIRWDDDRKLWTAGDITVAGGGSNVKPFELQENLLPGNSAEAIEQTLTISEFTEEPNGWTPVGTGVTLVYDFMLDPGKQHYAGNKVMAAQITIVPSGDYPNETIWVVVNGNCPC
jgi:hypothetical protein